jgi:two-component system sensor histidine kinase/response regulator
MATHHHEIASIPRRRGATQLEALANLAHELRTPVQVMLGYIDSLRGELTRAAQSRPREIVERMSVNAYDLACAVENVMEFASAVGASGPLADEEIDLKEFFEEIRPILAAANRNKHLGISIDLDGAPPAICSCRHALRAIVVNLAINAIKFTCAGTVTIAAWGSHRDGRDAIELEIRDTGPGIAPEMVHDAFVPMRQLSHSNTRAHRGLGLGLAVVNRNVDAIGGMLRVKTAPGAGSCFRVTLPCRAVRMLEA